MIITIKMPESLPFTEELKNVPRYASTHHETINGTGCAEKDIRRQIENTEATTGYRGYV